MQNMGKTTESWRAACQTRWLSFARTQTQHPQRERGERGWDKEAEQHTNISTFCNPGTSKPSPPIYLHVPVNQKAYFEPARTHTHTHTQAQAAFALCSRVQDWGREGKRFCCRRGNYAPQLTLSREERRMTVYQKERGGWWEGHCCVSGSAFLSASHLFTSLSPFT